MQRLIVGALYGKRKLSQMSEYDPKKIKIREQNVKRKKLNKSNPPKKDFMMNGSGK